MIATLGETTGIQALRYMRDKMMNDPEGNEILQLSIQYTKIIQHIFHLQFI